MSSFSFNGERKSYIHIERGWKRPIWAPLRRNFLSVPSYPGARLLNTQTEMRVFSVPVGIIAPSGVDMKILSEDIASWLITDQPKELIFDTEPDRTYLAVVDEEFDADEFVEIGQGNLKFICPMPYKLGKINTHKFTQEWSTETTSFFTNKGSVEAPALIEMTVKKPSTFLDVWFGEYPHNRDYFRIGYPLTVEETTVQERERVMWDEMATPIGWTPVTGQFDDMKGTGSFKSRGGYALYCEDYGKEVGFYGAIAKKNIPGGPLQDFEMEAWMTLKSKNIGEMGRVEVLLLDEASNVVARINMNDLYATAEITRAHMKIGNSGTPNSFRKLVDTSGYYSTTFNQFRGRLRIARRGKVWSVYVAKFIDGTEKDGASLVERWIDETGNPMTERKIAQVMIAICKWDNHEPVNEIQIDDLKIWKVNKVPSNTKPYIFDAGDKVIIDTERSLVTINGKDAINIKDIFSEFPKVIRGDNRIDIMPPDVNATISYRERYR
ncbi:distal tail protein Dit [Bacillus anthracis]|uniref:distal tail protein Dit n=1 Tax=Bacillus anthracis TaxID=1392 RepID=UPI001ADECE4C|nr:distal tail protein Dit [Bacillus anthracis]MBP0705030.1 phage tail family protein [Bacillus anthracis]MBP0734194.1 phage tail family protein [Bacillus anthracis]MBP0771466.1 phage tail family protein [Bacillus anthracis]MBP0918410.1 phage tail family protein [Bacillus anthracis]HDR5461913.1 phage tail family protein [Bacillus anthracis]